MAKLTSWLVILIAVLMILALIIPTVFSGLWFNWVIALIVLIIGITKLIRSYGKK